MICLARPHRSLLDVKAAGLWPERVRRHPQSGLTHAEPSLSDLLDEPIIQDLMLSDNVCRDDVEALFAMLPPLRQTH